MLHGCGISISGPQNAQASAPADFMASILGFRLALLEGPIYVYGNPAVIYHLFASDFTLERSISYMLAHSAPWEELLTHKSP